MAITHRHRSWSSTASLVRSLVLTTALCVSFGTQAFAAAQLTVLHSFTGSDGANPAAGLVETSDGTLWGGTTVGGANNDGALFKITSDGTFSSVYSFAGADGNYFANALVQGVDRNLYGITANGGSAGAGTFFSLTPAGTLTSLYSLNGRSDGYGASGLMVTGNGTFYGTTQYFGANSGGTLFTITNTGSFTKIYDFPNGDAAGGGLIQDSLGNLYGTTFYGGTNSTGTVFQFSPTGVESTLCSFPASSQSTDWPSGVVLIDGSLYGVDNYGGSSGEGFIYQVAPDGTFSILHSFSGIDGQYPSGSLIEGVDGNLYGTTVDGGANGRGNVFMCTTGGAVTTIYSFTPADGGYQPDAPLLQGADGAFYGTTYAGGKSGDGLVFKLSINPSTSISLSGTQGNSPWYVSGVGVTLTATPGAFPVANTYYTVDGGATQTYAGSFTLPTDGQHTLTYWSVDTYGNAESVNSQQIDIDQTPPVTTAGVVVASGVDTVTLNAADNLSGVAATYYQLNGEQKTYTAPFTLGDGEAVTYWSVDIAGNVEPSHTLSNNVSSQLASVTVSPHSVTGGGTSTVTVTLSAPAPSQGAIIDLSTSDSAAASFTSTSVTVPSGSTSTTVPVDTFPVTSNTLLTITGTYGSVSHNCHLTVLAPEVSGLNVLPSKLAGGTSTTGTVKLTGVAAVDTTIDVFTENVVTVSARPIVVLAGPVIVEGPVVVPAGSSETTFTIETFPVAADTSVIVTASLNGGSASKTITVKAPELSGIGFSPKTVVGNQGTTLTATLSSPAPGGGTVVAISYTNGGELTGTGANIVIPGGATSGSVRLTAKAVDAQTTITAAATLANITKSASLTVEP